MNSLSVIFDFKAILSLIVIFGIMSVILVSNFRNKDVRCVFSPSTFVCLVFLYYAIIGPFYTIIIGDTTYRLTDMSPYYSISWTGVAVLLVGYYMTWIANWKPIINSCYLYSYNAIIKSATIVFLIGFAMYVAWMGSNIKILIYGYNEQNEFHNEGAFVMYLMQGLGLLILPLCCYFRIKLLSKKRMLWFYLVLILVAWIYLNSGFRFRLVLLIINLATIYYITKLTRPNLLVWSIIGVAFILFMGVMEYSRTYEKGLDLQRIEGRNSEELFEGGTNEARIFMASGAVMAQVQDKGDYAYINPIMNGVLMPLPYAFFPQKRAFLGYMEGRIDAVFGRYGTGIAVMEYAEAFVAFGWVGVFLLGAFMGYLSKRIWNYLTTSNEELLPLLTLAAYNGFLYIFISRGYFAQILTCCFFYVIIPLFLFHYFAKHYTIKENILK